jgi:hypothetical protein
VLDSVVKDDYFNHLEYLRARKLLFSSPFFMEVFIYQFTTMTVSAALSGHVLTNAEPIMYRINTINI